MSDIPILFSAPMVKALLAGTKTQTRRLMKPQPELQGNGFYHVHNRHGGLVNVAEEDVGAGASDYVRWAPGDRLWVKETWRATSNFDALSPSQMAAKCIDAGYRTPWAPLQYEADGLRDNWERTDVAGKVRVSIHMPRWASRITLRVTDVRVQRLQDISPDDAAEEGAVCDMSARTFVDHYRNIWERINGAGSWAANPWIVALTFTVEQANIDGARAAA